MKSEDYIGYAGTVTSDGYKQYQHAQNLLASARVDKCNKKEIAMNEIFNHVGKSCWDCECVFEEGDSAYPEYSHLQEGLRFLCHKCYSKSMSLYRAIINWIKYKFHIHEWKLIDMAEKRQAMGLSGRECFHHYTFQCVICKSHKKEKL